MELFFKSYIEKVVTFREIASENKQLWSFSDVIFKYFDDHQLITLVLKAEILL